jgi:hypothetical protein
VSTERIVVIGDEGGPEALTRARVAGEPHDGQRASVDMSARASTQTPTPEQHSPGRRGLLETIKKEVAMGPSERTRREIRDRRGPTAVDQQL